MIGGVLAILMRVARIGKIFIFLSIWLRWILHGGLRWGECKAVTAGRTGAGGEPLQHSRYQVC